MVEIYTTCSLHWNYQLLQLGAFTVVQERILEPMQERMTGK